MTDSDLPRPPSARDDYDRIRWHLEQAARHVEAARGFVDARAEIVEHIIRLTSDLGSNLHWNEIDRRKNEWRYR